MFICLSSALTPRYRYDIIRTMAMPKGARLQFRYGIKLISPKARNCISKNEIINKIALIAHINNQNSSPKIIPCRFAKIIEVNSHGSTVSLKLELGDFAYTENLESFNNEFKTASGGSIPSFEGSAEVIKGGYLWFEIGAELGTLVKSDSIVTWEKITEQLAERDYFSQEHFYFIQRFCTIKNKGSVNIEDGGYILLPDEGYEISIYHFCTKEGIGIQKLHLKTGCDYLKFTTNPMLFLDSRYDQKIVRFKTGKAIYNQSSFLSVFYITHQGQERREFEIPLLIKGTYWSTIIYGVSLGILVGVPQVIATWLNVNLQCGTKIVITCCAAVFSIVAGIFAAFGLKKSI